MADDRIGAPALNTNIESGQFDEKAQQHRQQAPAEQVPRKVAAAEDDDEDEDIDALIEDLESQDGHEGFDEEEEEGSPGGGRVVPEEMLQTDSRVGLTESEVVTRRRKYGLNQMKEEKENLILKFFSYFVGPIQFVMEVSLAHCCGFFYLTLSGAAMAAAFICASTKNAMAVHAPSSPYASSVPAICACSCFLLLCPLFSMYRPLGPPQKKKKNRRFFFFFWQRCSDIPNGHCFCPHLHSFSRVFFGLLWPAQITGPTGARVGLQQLAHDTGWLHVGTSSG